MTEKGKIKVIKKGDLKAAPEPPAEKVRTKRVAAREMVSNVSAWVSEFQTRKRDETKIAIEKFFAPEPQPIEV